MEFDGPFHSESAQVNRDRKKNGLCERDEIQLIRIRYPGLPILLDCVCFNLSDTTDRSIESSIKFIIDTV